MKVRDMSLGYFMNQFRKRFFLLIPAICMVLFYCTACAYSDYVPASESQPYSKVENAYADKMEIDHNDSNIYKRTVVGTLKYIDDGDKAGLKKMLCKGLLDMKDTDAEIDALMDGFKGDIKDTTYISGDLGARTTAQWSKTEAVACYESDFYVYTDKETYYFKLDMCSVNDRESDGKDSVGVTRLQVMTLDKKYGMKVESGYKDGSTEYTDKYIYGDGTTKDAKTKIVGVSPCNIFSDYGSSDGYEVLNTSKGWDNNDVWKPTGTKDSISMEDLKKIDYTDEKAVREVFNSMEQYATTEDDTHCRLYNLKDSDKKVHVYSDNYGDGDEGYRVKFVQIIDISELYEEQDREYIYNYKDK